MKGKYKAVSKLIKELHEKGQPILVGTISIENSEYLSTLLDKEKIPHTVLNAKQHESEAGIVAKAGEKGAVMIATNMAGRGTDIKLTAETKEVGGLCIVGTERHESRRIDNQLRGRSGRQGDPGMSRFFLSLEDDLMRIFGSERIRGVMNKLGMSDDEPIEHKMITNAIAKAQMKVEGHNFDMRKHLLDFDNVMNEQRSVIYRLRREILSSDNNFEFVQEILEDVVDILVDQFRPQGKAGIDRWPWDEMSSAFQSTFYYKDSITSAECSEKFEGDVNKYFFKTANDHLSEKYSEYEDEQISMALREILLSIFDSHWKDHLLSMDHMKEGINLRAYAQKDPLNEYKHESFALFEQMRVRIKQAIIDQVFSVKLYSKEEIEVLKKEQQAQLEAQLQQHKEAQKAQEGEAGTVRRKSSKVGRNDPCPCGSGKKYKHCHG